MNFSRTFGIIVSIFLLGTVAAYSETGTPSITNGDIKTFTTAGDAAPATNVVAITGDATAVTSSGATLNGSILPGWRFAVGLVRLGNVDVPWKPHGSKDHPKWNHSSRGDILPVEASAQHCLLLSFRCVSFARRRLLDR